jgi:TctA family transporter
MLGDALRMVFLDGDLWKIVLLTSVYGVFMGAVPGLTATMAVALIVPLTFFMTPLHALAAVVTLTACAIFAGDIPAALVRIPGTPASAAYVDDMHVLSRRGLADRVLGVSLVFSVLGGLFGSVVLIFLAQPLAWLAAQFTYVEYFWFYMLGLGCAVVVAQGSALRGALALLLGLLLSTVGLSPAHAEARFTFGVPELLPGIGFIPALIGLFGISEVIRGMGAFGKAEEIVDAPAPAPGHFVERWLTRPLASVFGEALRRLVARPLAALRSWAIATSIGALPGAGADIAAWVSYGVGRRFSRRPEEYGKGSLEGLASASGANNAALAGAWVPTLVFGIPGDSVTAIVIGILMMQNLKPGPDIFEKQGVLMYGLYAVFILANLILIPVGFLAIKAGGWLVRVPRRVLLPLIAFFCVVGAYAIQNSWFDVGVMLVMGIAGVFLERHRIPLGPVVLGLVLGGPFEEALVQTLTASKGALGAFFSRPGAIVLGVLALALWLSPLLRLRRPSRPPEPAQPQDPRQS